jgi:Ca-activated chloride channel homolog
MDGLERRSRAVVVAVTALATAGLAVAVALALGSGAREATLLGRTLRLASPRWLALLACAPALALAAVFSVTDAPPRRRGLGLALRYTFMALLALVLAGPSVTREQGAVSVVAVADVSASITDDQLAGEAGFVERLATLAQTWTPRPSLRVVRFASEPEEIAVPEAVPRGRPGRQGLLGRPPGRAGQETDIGLAIGLALGLLEPGRVPRVLLLSDGRATKGDALAAAARAATRGVRIFTYRPAHGAERDLAVLDLSAPDDVRPHAGFELEIRLAASHATAARIRLTQIDGGRAVPAEPERSVALNAGVTTVRWATRIDRPGTTIYRAEIVGGDGNGRSENDVGVLAVAPRPRPRTLLVEARPAGAAPFVRALEAQGFEVDIRTPRALAEGPVLAGYDLVVLSDVGRDALGASATGALGRFVREGGGLLVAGGPDSFGSGGYNGTPLAALLPVRQEPSDQRQEATLALALVIDRSGSMSGPKMDLTKEAARGTAQMLAPDDLIAVIVFDSQAHPVVRLQPASNRQRILSDIAQIRASGGTNILPGLREAFDQLFAARARKKHVILLSDGQSPYEGIPELIDEAATARITVSAVGVGEGADQTLLQMIANRGGGRFYHTRDPASIPQIFTRETAEVSRSSVIEEPTRMRAAHRAEALAGLALESAPPLRGYSRLRARPEADLLLATAGGDPLLARWQVGLGQVAAWTSDLANRWSADLARWPSFGKMWGQLARASMRRGAANHFVIKTRLAGDKVVARIDALGADGQPLTGLDGTVTVLETSLDPRGPPTLPAVAPPPPAAAPLLEPAPGLYEAELPVRGPGALLLAARLTGAGGALVAEAQGRVAIPFARELLPESATAAEPASSGSSGAALLDALAARTGGGTADAPAALLDAGKDRVVGERPLKTPLLLVAILVFLTDLTLRRVKLRGSWRGVAQSGSAFGSGPKGRWFKSSRPDKPKSV